MNRVTCFDHRPGPVPISQIRLDDGTKWIYSLTVGEWECRGVTERDRKTGIQASLKDRDRRIDRHIRRRR